MSRVKAAIDLLKTKASSDLHANLHATQGVYTFIWAKVGQYLEGLKKGTVRLVSSMSKSAPPGLSVRQIEGETGFVPPGPCRPSSSF